jgi:ribonuclease D
MPRTTTNKAIEAANHPILLESSAQLAEAEKSWSGKTVLGIDTEFVRERTYRADLGLVQVSDGETAWLIDPLALQSFEPVVRMLTNPETLKILYSGSEDLEVLLHSMGVIPDPLVDSQVACALLGQPLQLGYHNACSWLFDVEIDKEQTRSNWCKRPLHAKQLHYAAMDVVLLPLMLEELRAKLEEKQRWSWLEEEVSRMQLNARSTVDPARAYLRLSGAGRLDDASLGILQRLASWREITAREKNRARGFVVSDSVLMQLAQKKPSTLEAVAVTENLYPGAMARYGKTILQIIEKTKTEHPSVERIDQLDNGQRQQLKEMRRLVQSRSTELGVEPALLASRREIEKLIQASAGGQPLPERFLGWRKEVISDDLISVIEKG